MNFLPSTLADEPKIEEHPTYNDLFVVAKNIPPEASTTPSVACSCVLYIKQRLGITESLGMARNIPITTKEPFIGAIVITYESSLGHAALVTDIDWSTRELILDESNHERCKVTHNRRLSFDSPLIKGYR